MGLISKSFSQREEAIRQRLKTRNAEIDSEFLVKVSDFLRRHDGPIYIFGYAPFANLGDQALWASLVGLLREIGDVKIRGLLPPLPAALDEADRRAMLIFPGGGSLGNRYGSSQRRVELIEAMRPSAILQMPISTTFANPGMLSIDRVAQAYNSAEKTLIFVRDNQSKDEAHRILNLSADLALDLSSLLPSMEDLREKGGGTLYLLRQDQEAASKLVAPPNSVSTDWGELNRSASVRLKILERLWRKTSGSWVSAKPFNLPPILKARERLAASIAEGHTARALALLGGFDRIVTDRLHGMLLARKLGIPCFAIDNDHNKLSRYAGTWLTADQDNITFFQDIKEIDVHV